MYTYELFNINDGFGYNVLCENNIIINQEYEPDLEGFKIMSKERAEENAKIIISRILGE